MTPRHHRDIPRFKDVTDEQWNDYRWQLRNRLSTLEDFEAVLNLTDPQRDDLKACMGKFRVAVTPYYASLMDPDDPSCPVRMQGVPTPAELVVRHEDLKDAVAEDFDSPTPRITHRYPDRVLFVVTEMCSMYCRHCTRRRLVGGTEDIVAQTEIDNAITYIERAPEVRDVLISGGDPLVLADEQLEEILARVTRHRPRGDRAPRVTHAGRLPAAHHARAGGDAQEVPPALPEHALQPPQGVHARVQAGVRRCWPTPASTLGNQTVLLRGVNDCANVMKKLCTGCWSTASSPTTSTSATWPRARRTSAPSVAKGIEIYESLRGHTTGFAVPTYIIDAIGGGGKTPVFPNYVISQAPGQVILRNYEGVISKYTEPDDYVEGECHCEDCEAEQRAHSAWPGCSTRTSPTLEDVWAARMQKVVDRKNRMADASGPAKA